MRAASVECAAVEIDAVIHSVIAVPGIVAAIAVEFPVANQSLFLSLVRRSIASIDSVLGRGFEWPLSTVPNKICKHRGEEHQQDWVHSHFHDCVRIRFNPAPHCWNSWKNTQPLAGLIGMVTWFPTTPGTKPQLVLNPTVMELVWPRRAKLV